MFDVIHQMYAGDTFTDIVVSFLLLGLAGAIGRGIVHAANGTVTFKDITITKNTVTQSGVTKPLSGARIYTRYRRSMTLGAGTLYVEGPDFCFVAPVHVDQTLHKKIATVKGYIKAQRASGA